MEQKKQTLSILHSACLLSPSSGMLRQMDWEQEAAEELGLHWRTVMYSPKNGRKANRIIHESPAVNALKLGNRFYKAFAWISLRINYYRWLNKQRDEVDVYILRYYVHDPLQIIFIMRSTKPVCLIHHSKEIEELAIAGTFFAKLRSFLEKSIGVWSLKGAMGIIGVTSEILEYQKARIPTEQKLGHIYPNGIMYTNDLPLDFRVDSGQVPELIFVAHFESWHGLDLLLPKAVEYEGCYKLHIVGGITEEMSQLISGDERIISHGVLTKSEIKAISARCTIGLSTFALHRKNMKDACPLKVREYLHDGLMVYGDHHDVIPQELKLIKSYKVQDEVDFAEIINFCVGARSVEKSRIKEMAKEYIDKRALVLSLYKWVNENAPCKKNEGSATWR